MCSTRRTPQLPASRPTERQLHGIGANRHIACVHAGMAPLSPCCHGARSSPRGQRPLRWWTGCTDSLRTTRTEIVRQGCFESTDGSSPRNGPATVRRTCQRERAVPDRSLRVATADGGALRVRVCAVRCATNRPLCGERSGATRFPPDRREEGNHDTRCRDFLLLRPN